MKSEFTNQQGDVVIETWDSIPKDARQIGSKRGRIILADGEHTGHAHAIEDIEGVQMFEKDGMFYIRVIKEVELKHEEHKAQKIEPGIYRVRGVREYSHFDEEARRVAD